MSQAQEITTEKTGQKEMLLSGMNEVASEMVQKLDAAKRPWGPSDHSQFNWASEIHHPCLKNLVHCRVDWGLRQPINAEGMWRIEEGIRIEWEAKKELGNIGYEITQSQRKFKTNDPELKRFSRFWISGKIDGMSPLKKRLPEPFSHLREVPIEVKSVNPNYWNSMKTLEDIKRHSKFWISKIPSQLNIYLAFMGLPGGFLIIATFGKRPRIIPMLFDEELWEHDTTTARKVNKHVRAGTYPEPIPYDATICGMCDFNHICTPLRTTKMSQVSGNDEMELEFFLELKEWNMKYEQEKKRLIGTEKEPGKWWGKDAVVGDISVNTKKQQRKTYDIPTEEKEKFRGEDKEVVITKIERVGK